MTDMTRQFVERKVKKTYHAIVNGLPDEPQQTSISSVDAKNMGVDVDCSIQGDMENNDKNDKEKQWQVIDFTLEEKEAVSVWKAMKYSKSLKAKDGYLTLVQVKPKTGRYHQIRRHMVSKASPNKGYKLRCMSDLNVVLYYVIRQCQHHVNPNNLACLFMRVSFCARLGFVNVHLWVI